jgi:hypothetical protein
VYEYNRVQNDYVEDPPDPNHDDGFQSWSVGPGGVGTGEVRNVVLRGNVFVNHTNPAHPLRTSMQAIGCFDGWFVNWVVENNVVITDHWHGISFLGMRDSRIVNNTVIDLVAGRPGPPWIAVNPHKNLTPSSNVIVRNNLGHRLRRLRHERDVRPQRRVHDGERGDLLRGAAVRPAPEAGHVRGRHRQPGLAPALDVERVARPQGAGFDLGAYERFVPTLAIGAVVGAGGELRAGERGAACHALGAAGQTVTVSFSTAAGTATAGSRLRLDVGRAHVPAGHDRALGRRARPGRPDARRATRRSP